MWVSNLVFQCFEETSNFLLGSFSAPNMLISGYRNQSIEFHQHVTEYALISINNFKHLEICSVLTSHKVLQTCMIIQVCVHINFLDLYKWINVLTEWLMFPQTWLYPCILVCLFMPLHIILFSNLSFFIIFFCYTVQFYFNFWSNFNKMDTVFCMSSLIFLHFLLF